MKNFKIKAFTLAEILITLLIIGVVASIVIPNLVNDSQKAEYVTKLQKEYAVLQQAYKLIILDSGGSILNNPDFNCSGTATYCQTNAASNVMNEFSNKLSVTKNCGIDTGCWYNSSLKWLGSGIHIYHFDAVYDDKYGKAVLTDGTTIMITIYNTSCTTTLGTSLTNNPLYNSTCGFMQIDINGTKGPNQYGRDYFALWIAKTGIYPFGIFNDGYSCEIDSSSYNTSNGCAGKVLSEGAMNY